MIKLNIKQIWNERQSNAWLWVELIIVFIALWVIVDWTYVHIYTYFQPRGFNIENTYQIFCNKLTPQSPGYISNEQKTTRDGEDFVAVMERLRHHPDIEYVSCASNSSPYNGSSSYYSIRQDSIFVNPLDRSCTPDFFSVFRYENADGSRNGTLAKAFEENTFIVSSNFCEERYPEGKGLLGQKFYKGNDSIMAYRIAAVTKPVRYSDFTPASYLSSIYCAEYLSDAKLFDVPGTIYPYFEICIRTRPGTSPDFVEKLLKDSQRLYNVGNCYIQSIKSFDDIRYSYQLDTVNSIKKRGFVMLFLLVNIFLGIIGTFWYRTQQRRAELGLHIALGSSRLKLGRYLFSEGMLLLLFAFIPAMPVCYHLGKFDLMDAWQMEWGISRFLSGILITFMLIALMILVGIWYPARQAMKVKPAEALHEE